MPLFYYARIRAKFDRSGVLQRLGIKIWLGVFGLDLDNEICNNNEEQPSTMKADCNQIWPSKEGLFCCCSFSHMNISLC